MKTRNVVRPSLPIQGRLAFAHAAAMGSLGACGAALHRALPTLGYLLGRNEDRMHPGEGSA